jgi:hypothetical protein
MAEGFVNGDLIWRAAALDFARQHLANLSDDVIVAD